MKVGLALHSGFGLESVRRVARELIQRLAREHELVYLPPAYEFATDADQQRMADELVGRCDLLVGFHSMLEPLLAARTRCRSHAPCVVFLLGALPRGAYTVRRLAPHLTTRDVLVVNSSADEALAGRFFSNMRIARVPFPVDETVFFPLSADERREARQAMGFGADSRAMLYAGRVSLEKNLHTTLRVFSAVCQQRPDTHLLIAGSFQDIAFQEVGLTPVRYARSIARAVAALEIPRDRIRFVGLLQPDELRVLYNVADVAINMTLHHDENFGLGQIEAMACGTPVVGTAWGGLRDTIRDGVSGCKVGTSVTPFGVKVNWWEAVNKTLLLLGSAACDRACVHEASRVYSRQDHEAALDDAVRLACSPASTPAAAQVSPFAEGFWATCLSPATTYPRYVHGRPSFDLYRALIESYTAPAREGVPPDTALALDQVLCLAAPIRKVDGTRFWIDDPLYPYQFEVPEGLRAAVEAILLAMTDEPAITVCRLRERLGDARDDVDDALRWMLSLGLMLRTHPVQGWILPETIDRRMARTVFTTRIISARATDFVLVWEDPEREGHSL